MKLVFLIIPILVSTASFSTDYFCPNIHKEFYIGQKLNDGWYIWSENEDVTLINKMYYKLFQTRQVVTYWGGFPTGWVNKGSMNQKTYIGC